MSLFPNTGPDGGQVIIVVDRADGGGIDRITNPQHSYVDNWYGVMGVLMHDDTDRSVNDTSGSSHDIRTFDTNTVFQSSSGAVAIGIGSSNSAFSQSNNSLGSSIDNQDVSSSDVEAGNQLVRHSASFSISASNTIRETGCFWNNATNTSGNQFDMLFERTVLATEVPVSDGDSVSVTYEHTWQAP